MSELKRYYERIIGWLYIRTVCRFFSDYKVLGTPSFYLLDAQGKVLATGIDVSDLSEKIETLPKATKGGD